MSVADFEWWLANTHANPTEGERKIAFSAWQAALLRPEAANMPLLPYAPQDVKDSARYRWAREQPADVLLDLYLGMEDENPALLDSLIDNAMAIASPQ